MLFLCLCCRLLFLLLATHQLRPLQRILCINTTLLALHWPGSGSSRSGSDGVSELWWRGRHACGVAAEPCPSVLQHCIAVRHPSAWGADALTPNNALHWGDCDCCLGFRVHGHVQHATPDILAFIVVIIVTVNVVFFAVAVVKIGSMLLLLMMMIHAAAAVARMCHRADVARVQSLPLPSISTKTVLLGRSNAVHGGAMESWRDVLRSRRCVTDTT